MKISYDKEADAAYFKVKKGTVVKTIKLQDWLLVDVDKNGALLGIEMLALSSQISKKEITSTVRAGKILVAA